MKFKKKCSNFIGYNILVLGLGLVIALCDGFFLDKLIDVYRFEYITFAKDSNSNSDLINETNGMGIGMGMGIVWVWVWI